MQCNDGNGTESRDILRSAAASILGDDTPRFARNTSVDLATHAAAATANATAAAATTSAAANEEEEEAQAQARRILLVYRLAAQPNTKSSSSHRPPITRAV